MIGNPETAARISDLLLEVSALLNKSVAVMVESDCAADEKTAYTRQVGELMGMLGWDILNRLYSEHPVLLPDRYYLPGISKE